MDRKMKYDYNEEKYKKYKKVENKPFIHFVPREIVKSSGGFYEVNEMKIDGNIWPENLIHNPELKEFDFIFWEEFGCDTREEFGCDTTFWFYHQSALRRCGSLIPWAIKNSNKKWEHGNINVFETENTNLSENWMTRTKVEIFVKECTE
jgi:hypothetical protein